MSPIYHSLGIDQLSLDDRILLVQEIWDGIAKETVAMPLSEFQMQEINRRLAAHAKNPGAAIPWEDVDAAMSKVLDE